MTEEVSQFRYIFLHPVEGHSEQVAKVIWEHFPGIHMSRRAQSLKFPPDVGALHGLSASRHEHSPGLDARFGAVGQQFLPQFLRNYDNAPFALAVNDRLSAVKRFHADKPQFRHADSRRGQRLHEPIQTQIALGAYTRLSSVHGRSHGKFAVEP